jgi:hypothetical protein
MDGTGTDRQPITYIQTAQAGLDLELCRLLGTLQQPMLIFGHTYASPEPRPTGLCKHSQTCKTHKNDPSTQPYAKLTQSGEDTSTYPVKILP